MSPRLKRIAVQLIVFVLLAGNIELYCYLHMPVDAAGHFGDMPRFLSDGAICQPDAVRGWRLRADVVQCAVNGDGLRGPEVTTPRPEGEVRILCLGGSVTWGWGLSDLQTYPHELEQKLTSPGQLVEVINGGTPGFTSENCAAMLLELAPRFQPQIVTLMIGFNEPWVQQPARGMREVNTLLQTSDRTGWLRGLLHQSYTYQYLYGHIESRLSMDVNQPAEKRWQISADNVRLMCEQARAMGIHLLIVWEARRSWASLEQSAREGNDFTHLRDPQSVENLRAEIVAVARSLDVPFLDMNEKFLHSGFTENELFQSDSSGEKFKYSRDPVHPTRVGSTYIADTLAAEITALGWLKP